jgi:N-acetylneuraminate synthase
METIIGNKIIGLNNPFYIIAEAADAHLGSMERAKQMVSEAKKANADAIKFQHHLPDEEMLPVIPMSDNFEEPLYEFLKKNALTLEQHYELKRYCGEIGIQYLCTPFSWKAAQELNEMGVDAYKIGSGEMTDVPTLERISEFGKPMIVSTGMCTFEEIDRTYNALVAKKVPLILMYCISEYPPIYEDCNLRVITQMIKRYSKALIGQSDHTPDPYTCFAGAALGAVMFEKHVTLDHSLPGPDKDVSLNFKEFSDLVDGLRKIQRALGDEKKIHQREQTIRDWAFRSIVAVYDIPKGAEITENMIWSKRPGTGIPAWRRDAVIGRRAKQDIKKNTLLSFDDIK